MPTWSATLNRYLAIGETQDGHQLSWEELCQLTAQKSEREQVSDAINQGKFELPASPEQE